MSKRAPPNEAKMKLRFARELETINKNFSGVVTRSNYWHAQLLRAQVTHYLFTVVFNAIMTRIGQATE